MTKTDIIRKITSRKFILVFLYFVFNILCMTGVIPVDVQEQWKGILITGAGIIAYIFGEGVADIAGIISQNKQEIEEEEYEG